MEIEEHAKRLAIGIASLLAIIVFAALTYEGIKMISGVPGATIIPLMILVIALLVISYMTGYIVKTYILEEEA